MRKRFRKNLRRAGRPAAPFRLDALEARTLLSTVSWINAYSGSWNSGANWSSGTVPAAGDDVFIGQPGFIQITLDFATSVNSLSITGDSLLLSGGGLSVATSVANNGTISLNYASHLNVSGPINNAANSALTLITSSGSTISANTIANSGKITIGSSDTITVTGNYSQAANGDTSLELGGSPASNQFGKLAIAGIATLQGKMEANLVNGYSPGVGDQFTSMTYSAESGAFTTFQIPSNSWFTFQPDLNPTNLQLTAMPPGQSTTTIKVAAVVGAVNTDLVGVNLGWWDPALTTDQTKQLVEAAGLSVFRFPGGSSSDDYHFNNPDNYRSNETTIPAFAQFIQAVGGKGLITIDYGSGSPQEAAAELAYLTGKTTDNTVIGNGIQWSDSLSQWQTVNWQTVSYWASLRASVPLAQDDGLNFLRINHPAFTNINLWEVGNEVYGGWEIDHHGTNLPDGTSTGTDHDPATYVQFAAAFNNFVVADQANLPTLSIGIDSWDPAGVFDNNWTRRVLTSGRDIGFVPGFISDHSYMQSPFSESDNGLLNQSDTDPNSQYDWITRFANYQNLLAQTIGTSAAAGVQIMATEYNSDITNPGKQLTSLVNGLFLADAMGTLLNSGYVGGMVWDLRDFWNTTGNLSGSLYGWREGGDYGLLGDPNFTDAPSTGAYIAYPSYFAEQLSSKIAQPGGQVLSTYSNNPLLSSYAVLQANGHLTLMVVNKNPSASVNQLFNIAGFTPASQATIWQYGMTQDTAQSQTTDGASALANFTTALSVTGNNFNYSFPAYSMTVIDLAPATNPAAPTVATAASGPATISATTAALSVLGAYAAGESNLIYTWAATAFPVGAPLPTFSENATNHSKNTTATFYAAGKYTFTVTIRALGGASTTSTVNITVNQTLAKITVTKSQPNLAIATTLQFTAQSLDQFNNTMLISPVITWTVANGGPAGTINSAGLYTSPASATGTDTILASSNSVQGSSTIHIISGPVNIIDLPNGFAGSSMILNGAGEIRGSNLILIDDATFQATSAFNPTPVNINTFTTQFTFHLNNAWPMGNGFTFIIQNAGPLALGNNGDGLGYAGISKSLAIKFDLYQTSSNNGSTGLFTNGAWPDTSNIELGQNGFNLRSWDPSQAVISYDGSTLKVVLTDLYTNATDTKTYTVNIPAIVGGSTAWIGFTAASASLTTAQAINSWTFTNSLTSSVATPTGLAATPGNALVALTWNPSFGASGYAISQGNAIGGPYTVIAPNVSGTTYTANNLTNGQAYYFEVSALSAGGATSLPSSPVSATPVNPATATIRYVDDGDPGFAEFGTWGSTVEPGLYYGNDHSFAIGGNGADYATFTFTNLTPGVYRVSATWRGDTNRNTATPFTINDGATQAGFTAINQQLQPSSLTDQGFAWGDLGTFTITGTTMIVTIRDTAAALYVDADAIRIERTGDVPVPTAPPAPTGVTPTASDSQVTLTWTASPGATSYTVKYGTTSGAPYAFSMPVPSGTTAIIANLTNGTQYYFVVSATNSVGEGAISTEVSATPASAPPPPPPPVIRIIDDGDAGFSTVGTWGSTVEQGVYYGNDHSFAIAGNGADVATYTFSNVTPGVYRVSATWRGDTNRNTATPFSIFDNTTLAATATINQQLQPASLIDQNFHWGDLATAVNITTTTLIVTIKDTSASLYVDADAIRIERVGDLGFTPPPPNPVYYVDDRGPGWSAVGSWGNTYEPGNYFGNGHSFAIGGNGADVASFTFTGLAPGLYRVSATWRGDTNRATNAPFTILDNTTPLTTVIVNQQNNPTGLTDAGFNWSDLTPSIRITSTTLVVTLSDHANLYVDADAIRIERIGN